MHALHQKKHSVVFWIIFLIAIAFVGSHFFGVRSSLAGMVQRWTSPLFRASATTGRATQNHIKTFTSLFHIQRDLDEAQNRIYALESRLATLQNVSLENQQLRERATLPPLEDLDLLGADVLMQNVSGHAEILINRGARDGVAVGDIVVTGQNVYLGSILSVREATATVRLSIDEESVFRVVEAQSNTSALAHGSHGTAIDVEHIPTDLALEEGMVFLYNDYGGTAVHRARLSVGQIYETEISDDRLVQSALLIPLYDWTRLAHVFIITNTDV